MSYKVGTTKRLSVVFKSVVDDTTPADPTAVTLLIQAPDNAQTTYTYLTDVELVRDGVGLYHFDLDFTHIGAYFFRWTGTGAVQYVYEGELDVAASIIVPQPEAPAPEFTYNDLLKIDRAIAGGAQVVVFDTGRRVEYSSKSDLIAARNLIRGYLVSIGDPNMPKTANRRRYRAYISSR